MGEYHRTDITTVHDDTASASHLLLLGYHRLAYEAQRGDRTHVARHLHRADVALHQLTVQIGVWTTSLRVELKRDVYVGHPLAQPCFVDSVGSKQPVA